MKDHLIMNLEGPMMSFGGTSFDQNPEALSLPTRSMLAGLIANAIGLERKDGVIINELQKSMIVAVGIVRRGQQIVDFQTTDITKPFMKGQMWTGNAKMFKREGSASALEKQMKFRPYFADARVMCSVSFQAGAIVCEKSALAALREPARPLFLGRSVNIPAAPIGHEVVKASDPLEALLSTKETFQEVWSPIKPDSVPLHFVDLPETKDFTRNVHTGETRYWRMS